MAILFGIYFATTGSNHALATEQLKIQKITAMTSLIIASASAVTAHCSPIQKDENNSLTYLNVVSKQRIDIVIFRRPWSLEDCRERKTKINRILATKDNVEIVAFGEKASEPDTEVDDLNQTPPSSTGKQTFTWTFDRISSPRGCEGYFQNSCQKKLADYP